MTHLRRHLTLAITAVLVLAHLVSDLRTQALARQWHAELTRHAQQNQALQALLEGPLATNLGTAQTLHTLSLLVLVAYLLRVAVPLLRRWWSERRQLVRFAVTDGLTGLTNRRGFEAALTAELVAVRAGGHATLLYLDADRFKWVNDTFGHEVGDQLLFFISQRLERAVKPTDVVARLGVTSSWCCSAVPTRLPRSMYLRA